MSEVPVYLNYALAGIGHWIAAFGHNPGTINPTTTLRPPVGQGDTVCAVTHGSLSSRASDGPGGLGSGRPG